MKAAFNLLMNDSPLGIILKPIFKFIKKANAGSVKVLEIQYDEVHLNEHKNKAAKSSTPSEEILKSTNRTAPPPPAAPRKISAKHAGYGGSPGTPGSAGTPGTGGTSGQINTNGTSSRITWADEYFDHFHEPLVAKKAAPKQIDPSSLPNGTFNRLLQEYEAKKSFKIKA